MCSSKDQCCFKKLHQATKQGSKNLVTTIEQIQTIGLEIEYQKNKSHEKIISKQLEYLN
jgi:biotin operon repressor